MMNRILGVVVSAAFCCSAWAQQCPAAQATGGKAATCQDKSATAKAEGDCSKSCGDKAGCCAKDYAKVLPAMKYKVGDKTVCCPDEAKQLAKGDAKLVKYVVGDKSFDDAGAANGELAKAINGYMTDAMTVRYSVGDQAMSCPMSAGELAKKEGKPMKYRLASYDFATEDAAKKAATVAKEASEKVTMKMMVGDNCVSCPTAAAELAKKENKKVEYVVGDTKTCCDAEAQVNLAKARAAAALAVLEKAAKGNA